MKIAAFPKCWLKELSTQKMSLLKWFDTSVQLECDGLELHAAFLVSSDTKYLSSIRNYVENLGMALPMMCYSPDFTIPDEKERKREIENQKRMIRVTAELGGSYCRTLSGQRRPEISRQQGIDWVVQSIEACIPTAEACGVKIVIENHYKDDFWVYSEFAQNKDVFVEIVDRIDSEYFGVQYDPSNSIVAGEDPIDLLRNVLQRVMTVHASDRHLLPGTSLEDLKASEGSVGYAKNLVHGVTGKGLNDYDKIFQLLRSIHFDSWISIEDGMNVIDELKESAIFLKRMRAKYWVSERPR